jgi:hypothetical protein
LLKIRRISCFGILDSPNDIIHSISNAVQLKGEDDVSPVDLSAEVTKGSIDAVVDFIVSCFKKKNSD